MSCIKTLYLCSIVGTSVYFLIIHLLLPHFLFFYFARSAELCRINEHQKVALDLDPYVKKLLNARRRVVLVNNILQNAQVGEYSVRICKASSIHVLIEL